MNKTKHYELTQWDRNDRLLMADFNTDNAKLDAALASLQTQLNSKADTSITAAIQTQLGTKTDASVTAALQTQLNNRVQIGYGTYTGNGETYRSISLSYKPLAVLVVSYRGDMRQSSTTYGGLAVGTNSARSLNNNIVVQIETSGFRVTYAGDAQSNASGTTYHYLTFYRS